MWTPIDWLAEGTNPAGTSWVEVLVGNLNTLFGALVAMATAGALAYWTGVVIPRRAKRQITETEAAPPDPDSPTPPPVVPLVGPVDAPTRAEHDALRDRVSELGGRLGATDDRVDAIEAYLRHPSAPRPASPDPGQPT